MRKEVLVLYGKRRPVIFDSAVDPEAELINLAQSTKNTFKDVIEQDAELIVQLKDEKLKGEFVDLSPSMFIPTQSVVRVVS